MIQTVMWNHLDIIIIITAAVITTTVVRFVQLDPMEVEIVKEGEEELIILIIGIIHLMLDLPLLTLQHRI